MEVYRSVEKVSWMPHPAVQGVKIKPLISNREHGLNVTCMLVNVPAGKEVPEHVHEEQDDILYLLQGKAVMWVDGTGDFSLEPGVIVRVPKGKKHKIFDVTQDLLIYDVFCPALM
ncbi:MAG: cupin domain-containing protein [Thermodesulfobacteriota bacterium]|nr:cupin domain-containing protein [Thermodesulfobacteriota bacterium]